MPDPWRTVGGVLPPGVGLRTVKLVNVPLAISRLLWLVTVDERGPRRVEALPLALDYAHTRPARREEFDWVTRRFQELCAALGTEAAVEGDRLVIDRSAG